jgi:hypothetical protein
VERDSTKHARRGRLEAGENALEYNVTNDPRIGRSVFISTTSAPEHLVIALYQYLPLGLVERRYCVAGLLTHLWVSSIVLKSNCDVAFRCGGRCLSTVRVTAATCVPIVSLTRRSNRPAPRRPKRSARADPLVVGPRPQNAASESFVSPASLTARPLISTFLEPFRLDPPPIPSRSCPKCRISSGV